MPSVRSDWVASLSCLREGRLCFPHWSCLVLVLLQGPSPFCFTPSVQHQGRLSLDLSHRACSDYSEMRASQGSNSLPSSARLGNYRWCLYSDNRSLGGLPLGLLSLQRLSSAPSPEWLLSCGLSSMPMFSEPLPSACCSVMVAVVSGGILVGVLFPDPQLVHPGCPVWIHTWGRCNSEESVTVVW